ncbi:hypothetical protein OG21DRAFT_1528348, partial [Imleria badia]
MPGGILLPPKHLDSCNDHKHLFLKKIHCINLRSMTVRNGLTLTGVRPLHLVLKETERNHSRMVNSQALTLVNQDGSRAPSRQGSKYSKTSKADVLVHPITMAFFGLLWSKLLDEGKAKLHLHLTTEDPFLPHETAIDGICTEIIVKLVIKYEEGLELEAGFYPEYGREMAIILYSDTQTFRSEVKKCVTCSVAEDYHLFPPETLQSKQNRLNLSRVKQHSFLRMLDSYAALLTAWGKPATSRIPPSKSLSDKALRQFPDFQEYIPERALLLVAAIVKQPTSTVNASYCYGRSKA